MLWWNLWDKSQIPVEIAFRITTRIASKVSSQNFQLELLKESSTELSVWLRDWKMYQNLKFWYKWRNLSTDAISRSKSSIIVQKFTIWTQKWPFQSDLSMRRKCTLEGKLFWRVFTATSPAHKACFGVFNHIFAQFFNFHPIFNWLLVCFFVISIFDFSFIIYISLSTSIFRNYLLIK